MAILVGASPGDITRPQVLKVRRRLTVRDSNGKVIAQKWPRPRGPRKTPLQQAWVDKFTCIAQLSKSPEPWTLIAADHWANNIRVASAGPNKGSGWFYRDVIARAMNGKLIMENDEVRVTTPTALVKRTANQSVPGTTFTTLLMDGFEWDNNGFWSATVNPGRLTIRSPGLYLVGATATKKTNGTGNQLVAIYRNGSVQLTESKVATAPADANIPLSTIDYFHADDYIELKVFTSNGPLNWAVRSFWVLAITPEGIIP